MQIIKYIPMLFIWLSLFSCNGQSSDNLKQKEIKELLFLRKTYMLQEQACFSMFYVVDKNVRPYSIDTLISNFVKNIKDSIRGEYDQISFTFYKESNVTNENHLKENPRDLDRYSQQNDMIWMYNWQKKTNKIVAYKFKDGEIIYPNSEIKVEDINHK